MLTPLHVGFPENPGFLSWQFEPAAVVGISVTAYLYFRWIKLYEQRNPDAEPISNGRKITFVLGLATFVLALLSPVDTFGAYLLSMHMVQHILLTIVGPPLLILGLPKPMVAAMATLGTPWRIWRALTNPIAAFILFNAFFSLLHLPILYNLILTNEVVHVGSHLILMGTALLSWWSVLAPGREYGEIAPALKILYLTAHTVPSQIVGAVITLASGPLYPEYTNAPMRLWGLSLQSDQEIGGLLMWTGMGMFYLAVAGIAFYAWANPDDNKERDRLMRADVARS